MCLEVAEIALVGRLGQCHHLLKTRVIWILNFTRPTQLPIQIIWVNFLSRLNLLVCWVLKLSPHRPQWRSAMFVKSKSWITLNLILLCGDVNININPGPNWKCPCRLCKKFWKNHNKHKLAAPTNVCKISHLCRMFFLILQDVTIKLGQIMNF